VVLGSAMLEPQEALPRVAPRLRPEHFYFTAHREVYKAILRLYEKADAPDTLAVANYLEEQGKLDQVGGRSYLSELLSRVTTVAALDHYVDIVEVKALRRGLIDGGARISELGYREDMELESALDRAEELIYKLSKRGTAQEYWSLRDFLQDHVDELEELHKDPERRPARSLSTGFSKFDDLTSGLHPSNLLVLAGRPGTGKTSLALDIARDAALRQKKTVGFFSMEMPKEQILERLLCSQARVDLHRLRAGYLPAAKWGQIAEAAGQINEAVVLVDDTPAAPVLSIRSKARRMNSEYGLDLIIVDYLQLIDAGVRTDIREQEISYISRSLKGLARELNVPVIACSQLNRAVERRETKRPQLSDLRECVTGDTLVTLADGRRVPIHALVGEAPEVLALGSDGRLHPARAECVWKVGTRDVYAVQLASGRVIRGTADHRLYAYGGWKTISRLSSGDRLAVARHLPEPEETEDWPDDHVILLAHLIGDGSYIPGNPLRYTTGNEDNSRLVAEIAERSFGVHVSRHEGPGNWHQLVFSGNGNRWHPAGINRWLRVLGLFGQRSHDKTIPEDVFRLPNRQVALFLRHLWATDGTISTRKEGQRGSDAVHLSTCSRALAEDTAALLLRMGIVARLKCSHGPKGRPWYTVYVSGSDAQRSFLEQIGAFGPRTEAAKLLKERLVATSNTNVDTLPQEVFSQIKKIMQEKGISHREMTRLRGTSYGGSAHFRFAPSRRVALQYADALQSDELKRQATSDIFWDRVVSIEPQGQEVVYDLTVPGPNSWLADAIVSHNSGAIEQDADAVVFIYRPDYYEQPSQEVTVADTEIIVAKQRNGPLGKFVLRFHKNYASFSEPARQAEEVPF